MQPSAATSAAQSAVQQFKPLDSTTATNTANQQYGVDDSSARLSALKGIVGNLQTSLNSVDPSVTGRTSGTFTTEGQRAALVNNEQAPIASNLNKQTGFETSAAQDLTQKQSLAGAMATSLLSNNKDQYQRLLDQYNQSTAQDQVAQTKAEADRTFAEQQRQFNVTAAQNATNARTTAAKSAASGAQVNPAQDFLNYLSGQFKASGANPSRQSQDAWANAWFANNGVSNQNRQQYWNLYNSTYNRVADPTKDWLWKK